VRYITEREMGGILLPDDKCSKSGLPITDALESKHPHARSPNVNALPHYKHVPEFIEVHVTEDAVEKTVHKLSGGTGLEGGRLLHPQTLAAWIWESKLSPTKYSR
jgi:hypothetical protein